MGYLRAAFWAFSYSSCSVFKKSYFPCNVFVSILVLRSWQFTILRAAFCTCPILRSMTGGPSMGFVRRSRRYINDPNVRGSDMI